MMKRFTILFLAVLLMQTSMASGGPRDDLWKQVDEAVNKGLPKTAVERLEPIIEGALKDKAYAEAVKAIGRKIALEGNIQGNKPEEKITRMQAEIAKAPDEMKPVMEAILANWYWHYFQQNRWRFMQRTATEAPPSDDFTTWDLPRIFAEIDKQFAKALSFEKSLKTIPVAQYDDLLQKGTMPDKYRPTLWDFLVYNALEFYATGEQAAAKAEDSFELLADSAIFGPADEFMKWQVESTDTTSVTLKAVRLYQEILKFHQNDDDKSAYADADLSRLVFGNNKAFGEEKAARYKAALKRFSDQWSGHEVSARALYHWAEVLRGEGELVESRELALRGTRAYPDSVGGKLCYNLVQQIESKSASITTERVWNDPWPTIRVQYRNVTKIYFRAVADDFLQRVKSNNYRPEYLNEAEQKALLAKKATHEWSADLPATDDYQQRTEMLDVPKELKPGFYFLIASHDPGFGAGNNQVTYSGFWVSDLALVVRNRYGDGLIDGFVLNAVSGEPIAGAEVRAWYRANNNQRVAVEPVKTDENGLFRIQGVNQRQYLIHAQHADQQLASGNEYYNYRYDTQPKPITRTFFFTDRSLYRPGQTIQFKGICVRVDQEKDSYAAIGGQTVSVVFADVNGKEIAKQQHRTNDYGSFSGSFTAPRDRLMGRMSIRVEGEPSGAASVSVEEYKRPKFQVTMDKPKVAAKLNDTVSLKGTATAYTGAAIDHAGVRWRVVREVRYPIWWHWHYWWRAPQQNSQEIAHGTATTAVDGSFPIEFTAKPDLSVSEKDEPTFRYVAYADVTDTTGETRSAQIEVNVGYTALQASLTAGDWLTDEKPIEFSIRTTTLDGEGQQAEGTVKIYRLKQPDKVQRPDLSGRYRPMPVRRGGKAIEAPEPDPSNPNSWPLGDMVVEEKFTTDAAGNAKFSAKLDAGPYRAMLETHDRFGKKVTAQLPLQVLDPDATKFTIKVPNLVAAPQWSLEPGGEFSAVWGSGYDQARAFVEIEHRRKLVQSYWTPRGRTQVAIKQAVDEAMRGGFTLRVTMVRENRAYLESRHVDVPWTNKNLKIRWEHFVSKLQPGQKETWTAVITGPDAKLAVAEMAAALYDESLDAYLPHNWTQGFGVFRYDSSNIQMQFENMLVGLNHLHGNWPVGHKDAQITYRSFPNDLIGNIWGHTYREQLRGGVPGAPMAMERAASKADANGLELQNADRSGDARRKAGAGGDLQQGEQPPGPNLGEVSARTNLNETAFFFPQLLSDKDGEVKLEFTMPEALTKWKFLGFAHDRELRGGYLTDSVVTAKDLMIQPNPPRFVREGDVIEFTVKVTNQSPTRQTGAVRLTLADARTGSSVDAALANTAGDQAFDIPSKESRSFSWRLSVPDDIGFLTYKAVGSTGRLSDGEEGYLPVLSRRIFITESLPLPIRGAQTKTFDFTRLRQSGQSDTLKNKQVTVQMVSNPSWYAVMALPYLMEFPHECTEQTFNRLYANSLARHIANSDPKIRRVFDQWKNPLTPTRSASEGSSDPLDSPLEKNQDLKSVMIEETPWLRQAQNESQARRNVGILFDENRLNQETAMLHRKLSEQQLADGAWPWFPGGPANDYITLYITTGFGRMRHLGAEIDVAPAVKSLARLDGWIDRTYREILKHGKKDDNHLSYTVAFYLYGRSFFLKDKAIDAQHKEAVDYFLGQARKYWLQLDCRQSQAHLAIALKRFGDPASAEGIMRSIKERSVTDEELGMFWRDLELSWWWFRAPIETQAMMIEAFDEVMNDAAAVEECKVWLLKQKQTQDWKTTKATADAVYALLLRGSNLLASDTLVEVSLGGQTIKPENVEAGTGFYQQRFTGGDIKPQMGQISVKKLDAGVAWGSVHWQYLEDMSKVTPYDGTPLKLRKTLYTKQYAKTGPVLSPVTGPLSVGDELVVRIELRVDRDMEYVHLKDQRGSGTEPVNVLSRYKYQDGLAYYESTRDTASHFFIDYLPKGVYVFEYSTRVQLKGRYQTGVAEIQSMYAPEFNSHSESIPLVVQ
jgi:hypothetical protein